MSPSIIQQSTGPNPQMFVPRKPSQYEQLTNEDLRSDLLHIQNQYNVHDHGSGALRFATKVIAASNSLDTIQADYTATGTADQSTLQTAVDALPANGGLILLMDGAFHLTGQVSASSKQNVNIAGMGGFGGSGIGATRVLTWEALANNTVVFNGFNVVSNLAWDVNPTGTPTGITLMNVFGLVQNVTVDFAKTGMTGSKQIDLTGFGAFVTNCVLVSGRGWTGVLTDNGGQVISNNYISCDIAVADSTSGNFENIVTANVLDSNPTSAVLPSSNSNDWKIQNNICRANGDATHDAITVTGTRIDVTDNRVWKDTTATRTGISVTTGAVDCLVAMNDLRLSGTASYADTGTGTVINFNGSTQNWNLL